MKSIQTYIKEPGRILMGLSRRHFLNWMPDEWYLKIVYRLFFKKKLNLKNPITFNEKLQWLKLFDRNPLYNMMVDKHAVKAYIAEKIGSEYIIPTIGVWESVEDIDFSKLPEQFVLKCNHDSGGIIICKDKSSLDIGAARRKLSKCLRNNGYWYGREWPYKNVKPCIIAEQYMVDDETDELRDYKFFCFGGVCKCLKVDFDRFIEHRANYYDTQGNMLDIGESVCPPDPNRNIVLPTNMEKMIEFAEMLSKNIPFLRVDFYDVNGDIYFGELTFFPASGVGTFTKEIWDYELGKWIELPESRGLHNM